jgi:hypothetical protein
LTGEVKDTISGATLMTVSGVDLPAPRVLVAAALDGENDLPSQRPKACGCDGEPLGDLTDVLEQYGRASCGDEEDFAVVPVHRHKSPAEGAGSVES